jgi:hypothetical protein
MSRSAYDDGCDGWELIRWRGAVRSAIKGKRGQAFLRELADTLDAMPEKKLIEEELINERGECCTMGAVFKARGIDVSDILPDDADAVATAIGLSQAMVREIAYENDEAWDKTPEDRWKRMRAWVAQQIL